MPTLRALVWKRSDFRESSRIVTLLSREEGRLHALAKGAHRPNSPFQGRLDFLNLVDATVSGRPGTLRLLARVKLVHEPRGLRDPARYLAASHLAELLDPAWLEGRVDEPLFDLLCGGLTLLERCPSAALGSVVAGLELRYLRILGLLPPLRACVECGREGPFAARPKDLGLWCREHALPAARPVAAKVVAALAELEAATGKDWPGLPPPPKDALRLLGDWLGVALERRLRLRGHALQQLR